MSVRLINGVLLISVASIVAKMMGSFYRIPLQNIAGNEVLGIVTLVYPVYMMALTLSVAGIPLTISKLIAEAREEQNELDIYYIYKTAKILALFLGVISFLFMILAAERIAQMLGGQDIYLPLIIVSSSLLLIPSMAVYRGLFQGYEDMRPTALSQLIEQAVRLAIILVAAYYFVLQNYSPAIIASGVMAGSVISIIVAKWYLRSVYTKSGFKQQEKRNYCFNTFLLWSKKILNLSIPVCISSLTLTFIYLVDSITVPTQLTKAGYENINDLYGFYGRGLTLVQIPVVFAQALILPLVPALSKKGTNMNKLVNKAIHYTHLITWPLSIAIVALTIPLNYALFGDFQESLVLSIVHLSALFITFSVLTTGILQGINRPFETALIVIGCSILKVKLNAILIGSYGFIGLAYSTVIVFILMSFLNLWIIKTILSIKIWKRSYTIFSLSSIVMGIIISTPMLAGNWITDLSRVGAIQYILLVSFIGFTIYAILILRLKAMTTKELTHLPVIGKYIPFS